MQKGFIAPLLIAVAVVLIAGGLLGAFYFGKKSSGPTATNTVANQTQKSLTPATSYTADKIKGWKTYENKQDGLKFSIPHDMKVQEAPQIVSVNFEDTMGHPVSETIYIDTYTKEEFEKTDKAKLLTFKINEKKKICDLPVETCTYTRLNNLEAKEDFFAFRDDNPWEGLDKDVLLIATNGSKYYTILFGYENDGTNGRLTQKLFEDIVRTFEII